eukprot:gene4173-4465_t
MKLLLLIFLGTITLIRRAQKNIFTRLEANPSSLLGILPQDEQGLNLRSSVHEGNIQRVISILQGNIKQWSFIEAQLLEPNVNLAMPEIFIPLKHLTTTLEILGNIFFMKNDYDEARKCLERACPLMELLPSSILESFESATGQSGGDGLINEFNFISENEIDETIREQIILNNQQFVSNTQRNQPPHPNQFYHSTGKNYAADCFELLRNVYIKLYGLNNTSENNGPEDAALDSDEENVRVDRTESSSDSDNDLDGESNFSGGYDDLPIDEDDATGNDIGVTSVHEKFIEIETKIEELRSPFQHLRSELQMVQDRTSQLNIDKFTSFNDADLPIIEEIHDENEEEENSQPRSKIPRVGRIARHNGEKNKLSRLQKESGTADDSSRPQSSASPNDMLPPTSSFLDTLKRHFTSFFSSSVFPSRTDSSNSFEENEDTDMDSSASMSETLSFMQDDEDELRSDFTSSSAFRGLSGSATSIIASDLEVMLRKFVREDEEGRREIFYLAKKYYDDLEMNFPQMDENEYSANMDLGTVYLEIMGRVVDEGFGFVGPELEKWQDIGHSLVTKHIQPVSSPHSSFDSSSEMGEASSFGVGIIWEIDPETGKKQEFAVELDGSYFDAFTLQERNRLLVLSAFDIALNLEPYEQFDLSLGFGLGILDNDRSRQREHASLSFYHQTTPNQQPHLLNVQKPVQSTHPHSPQPSRQKKGRKDESPSASTKGVKKSKRSNGSKSSATPSSASSTSSVGSGVSSSKVENELEPSLFMDQTSATLEIPAALRSSVPMIKIENDWTFFLLMSFLAFTLIVVYIAYYQELLKRRLRQRSSSTRNQKKVGANGASLTNGVNTSETGYGFYDIICFMMMDWYDFFVPIFVLLLAKISSLSHDLYQSAKIALSRSLVQVTLLLRERREMIFHSAALPTATNHVAPGIPTPSPLNTLNSAANKPPLKKLPSASSDNNPGSANQTRKSINPPAQLPKPPPTNRPPSPHRSHISTQPQQEIQSKSQSWQQIIAHETTSLGSTSTSTSSVTQGNAEARTSELPPSVKPLNNAKEEKHSKKKGQNNGNAHSSRKVETTVAKQSSVDVSNVDISSDSDFHLSDEEKDKRVKKVESGKGSKGASMLANRVENNSVEEIVVSEEFMLSQPEQYEALVSSLLAEGQWKEAKKKPPKKSNHSTVANPSIHLNPATSESNKEKDKKPRSSKISGKPGDTTSSKRSSVGNGNINSTVATSGSNAVHNTSPSTNQAKIEETLSAEKRAASLTLNLESMLPPAVLEHKPSSLPLPSNPKSWKTVATRNTGQAALVERHELANSVTEEQGTVKGGDAGKRSSIPTSAMQGKELSEATSTPTTPPELPAMPALLPTTTVPGLGFGSGKFSVKDDATNQLSLSFSSGGLPAPSLQSNPINLVHAPPPGLLNIRAQPTSSSGYPLHLGTYNNPNFNPPNGSLLSSLLGSALTDDVREGSLLTGAGVLNEDDGDSNELLRGMLDDILRPASPPLMDRLFSAKTISQDALPYSTVSNQSNGSTLFTTNERNTSHLNSTNGLFFSKSSMEDIISDLSPDAPVFEPNPTQTFVSPNLHEQFATSLTNNLLNDDYWSFPGSDVANTGDYANTSQYHLTSQIDDFLADTLQFPETSSPPRLYPQQH